MFVRSLAGAVAPLLAVTLSACAASGPKGVVVLLPDSQGKVGEVQVTSGPTTSTLSKEREAVPLTGPGKPVGDSFIMDAAEVDRTFGAALAASPPPPAHFILYFQKDSTSLTAESEGLVPAILEAIRLRPDADASVVGHTDTVGAKQHNYELSLKRAQAVADLLVSRGVSQNALSVASHGEENLLVPTPDETPEPRNRRVEVTVR